MRSAAVFEGVKLAFCGAKIFCTPFDALEKQIVQWLEIKLAENKNAAAALGSYRNGLARLMRQRFRGRRSAAAFPVRINYNAIVSLFFYPSSPPPLSNWSAKV